VSELAFLSPDRGEAPLASPLARVLRGQARVRDLSLLGKIEVRGDVDAIDAPEAEVVRITDRRALVLCPYERCAELRATLPGFVVDMTGALAGLEVQGEQVVRRLTDLDLDALPAVGAVARVQAVVSRDGERFRIFVPQELGHYVAEVVLDALDGIAS
jgi:hypothetical protein